MYINSNQILCVFMQSFEVLFSVLLLSSVFFCQQNKNGTETRRKKTESFAMKILFSLLDDKVLSLLS